MGFDWLEVSYLQRVELKFVSMVHMTQSVMISGMQEMLQLYAGNLATVIKVCRQHLCLGQHAFHLSLSLSLSLLFLPYFLMHTQTLLLYHQHSLALALGELHWMTFSVLEMRAAC